MKDPGLFRTTGRWSSRDANTHASRDDGVRSIDTMVRILFALWALLCLPGMAKAQSLEVYGGHERGGVDLMWIKNFRNAREERTPFLFFSRNRASVDRGNEAAAFGSTNAVSWNFRSGMGIVAVGSFTGAGFIPKAGIQYYRQRRDLMFFGWLVADMKRSGNVDLFGMFRYTPPIGGRWRGFGQLELFPVYRPDSGKWNLTQRLRLGAKYQGWAAGFMADLNQAGRERLASTRNLGFFLRYDF